MTRDVKIEWGPHQTVTGRLAGPARAAVPSVLLAHGAGAGQDHPGVAGIRDRLAGAGVRVLLSITRMPKRASGVQIPNRRC